MKTNFFGRRRVVNASVHWIQPNIKRYQVSVIIGNNNNHVNGESNDNNGKNLNTPSDTIYLQVAKLEETIINVNVLLIT